jgi:hypothetical protein
MKTREKSDTGIRYRIVSAGSGQAEASRNGQEVVEMKWTWILTYIRLSTQRSLNVLLPGVEKWKWPQLEVNAEETFSCLWSRKLRKIWMGFQDIYIPWCSYKPDYDRRLPQIRTGDRKVRNIS